MIAIAVAAGLFALPVVVNLVMIALWIPVLGSGGDPVSGFPGLMTDTRWRYTGFVRVLPSANRNTHGPIVGVNFDIYLGGGWWYRG